jgi:glycosyltransferase involved in cell wall biosynthesis
MSKVLYVWKGAYPWDIRADKVCRAFSETGWDVYILARWIDEKSETEVLTNNIKVIRTGYEVPHYRTYPVSVNPIWKKAILKLVNEIKPDLIMPRDIMLAELCGKVGRKYNIPVIMDMAENYPAAMKGWKKYKRTFLSRLLVHKLNIPELVEKRAVKLMDGIITVCQEQNERLKEVYDYDINRMCVAHNTPETDFFSKESLKDNINQTQNNTSSKNYPKKLIFGHHGYTSDEKSLVKFLFGFQQASLENKNIEFHIAGTGESIEELRALAEKFSSRDRIKFYGEYSYEDLPEIINRWDIGVIPYQLNEFNNFTIHNKIFDFFAMGKPVFCSETKPFMRLIKETGAGINVNCEREFAIRDAILKIYDMDLTEMSKRGRESFEKKYNWSVDSKNILDFVNKYL